MDIFRKLFKISVSTVTFSFEIAFKFLEKCEFESDDFRFQLDHNAISIFFLKINHDRLKGVCVVSMERFKNARTINREI